MKDKKDYSRFYISMVIILAVLFVVTNIGDAVGDVKHSEKDLAFAKEMADFVIFQSEIIGYCANMSNLSNNELLTNFLQYKSDEIINEFALGEQSE